MTALVTDRLEVRALLGHAALCFTLASGLGFIVAGLAGLDLKTFVTMSAMVQDLLGLVCVCASFIILWCSPDGPSRWRPFIVSTETAEVIFGAAATVIVFGGIVAVTVFCLG